MPENELLPEVLQIADAPPIAADHVGRVVRPEVQARAKARLERQRQENAAHKKRLDAVEALQSRCKMARVKRTSNYLEMLDLIAEMPALPPRQRLAIIAEIFGLGRAEAARLIKIGQLETSFRELMLEKAIAPDLIEALLRAPEDVREIAMDYITQGATVEKADLLRLKRELERDKPSVVASRKNRSLESSLVTPVRERLKGLKASMNAFAVLLQRLHRVGISENDLTALSELVITTAAGQLVDFENCFGKDRLIAAATEKRSAEQALSNLPWDRHAERLEISTRLADNWSYEELKLTETHDALRKLSAGDLMPEDEFDDETDYYLSRYLLESVSWFADHDLTEYSLELDNITSARNEDYQAYYGGVSQEYHPLTSLELCAGAGGEAIGLHFAGFEPLGVFEADDNAINTLKQNYPFGPLFHGDLREVDFGVYRGKIDLLAGGVPCQPFSSLGNQQRDADERDLFMDAVKIAAAVQPRAVMLENVQGFGRRAGKLYVAEIMSELRKAGYSAKIFNVAARDYGLAQNRPRVVLVAFRDSALMRGFKMPPTFPEWNTTVGKALHDLMAANGWRGAEQWAKRAAKIAPTLVGGSSLSGSQGFSAKVRFGSWEELGIDPKKLSEEAPDANDNENISPRLTIAMGARLQGFPDGWQFQGSLRQQRRQVANAFPPIVAAAIGLAIRQSLTGQKAQFEADLSKLRFRPGAEPEEKWWGDVYINSRMTLRAEELGLPTGIVARNIPDPAFAKYRKLCQEKVEVTEAAE